jgi:hypothetical protein
VLSTDVKSYYASIDYLMLPDQLTLHIKGNSPILRPIHGRILVLAPARSGAGGGQRLRFAPLQQWATICVISSEQRAELTSRPRQLADFAINLDALGKASRRIL